MHFEKVPILPHMQWKVGSTVVDILIVQLVCVMKTMEVWKCFGMYI